MPPTSYPPGPEHPHTEKEQAKAPGGQDGAGHAVGGWGAAGRRNKTFSFGFFVCFVLFFFLSFFFSPPYSLGGVAFPFLFPLRFFFVVSILYFTDITRIVYSPSSFLLTAHRITHMYTPTKMLMNPIPRRFRLGPPPSPPPATPPPDSEDRRGTRGHLGRPAGSPHPAPPLTSYSNHNLVYYAALLVFADAPT